MNLYQKVNLDDILSGVKFVIVDDDVSMRELLTRVLVKAGAEVYSTANGLEVIPYLESHDLDVIITNVRQGNWDGYSLAECVAPLGIPVFFFSGQRGKEDLKRASEAGALGYFHKGKDGVRDIVRHLKKFFLLRSINRSAARQCFHINKRMKTLNKQELLENIQNLAVFVEEKKSCVDSSRSVSSGEGVFDQFLTSLNSSPIITAQILRLGNAKYLEEKGRRTGLESLINYFGHDKVRSIMSKVETFSDLDEDSRKAYVSRQLYSIALAHVVRALAKKNKYIDLEEAYIAGLLQGLDLEVLSLIDNLIMSDALAYSFWSDTSIDSVLTEVFGEMSLLSLHRVLAAWGCPAHLSEAMVLHRKSFDELASLSSRDLSLTLLVKLSSMFVGVLSLSDSAQESFDLVPNKIARKYEFFSSKELKVLVSEVEQAQERYLKTVPIECDLSVAGLGASLPLGTTVCLATSSLFDLDFLESYFSVRNASLQKKNVREIMEVSKDLCDLLVIDVQNILFAKKLTGVLNDLVEAGFDRDIIIVHSAKYSIYMQEYTNLKHHFIARPVYAKKLDALLDLIFHEKT